jgi:hypothetical protein
MVEVQDDNVMPMFVGRMEDSFVHHRDKGGTEEAAPSGTV